MNEIIAYEMIYNKELKYQNDIICVPFQKEYSAFDEEVV